MAVTYPNLTAVPPSVFNSDYFASWDAAMQQLAIANHVIAKCEACGMPVQGQREECDALCEFYQGLNAHWRGPGSTSPEALKG